MNKKILILIFGIIFLMSFISAFNWNNGITSYYSFNEGSGSNLLDNVTKTHNGTLSNASSWVSGRLGNSVSFDGVDDLINITNSTGFFNSDNVSISFWIYPIANTTTAQYLWDGFPNRNYHKIQSQWDVRMGGITTMFNGEINYSTIAPWTLNSWHHVVFIYNSFGNNQLWVDGTSRMNDTTAWTPSDSRYLYVGLASNLAVPLSARLDEMGFWNRRLNASEIAQLYNGGSGLAYNPTVSNGGVTGTSVNLVTPLNDSVLTTTYISFKAFVNNSGTYNITNETLRIWFPNGTLAKSQVNLTFGISNLTIIYNLTNFAYGQRYWWNVFAFRNDSNITYSSDNYTFTSSVYSEDLVTYNSSALETTNQSYKLQLTSISTVNSVSGKLWYNGSSYSSSITDGTGGGKYNLTNFLSVPLQNSSGSKSFFWQIDFTLTTGATLQQNSTTYSQEVNKTILIYCDGTYATKFINFTTYSATNPFPRTNATFKSAFTWYILGGDGSVYRNYTYEDVSEVNSTWTFCGNYNSTFVTSANIEYDATNYALNHYYLSNAQLSNSINNIPLYLLNDSKATATVLKVVDSIQNPIEDVLISIQYYDVGTDTFYTIGMGKTSFTGETLVYLNWYDSLYKFILTKNGEVLKSTTTTGIFETPQIFKLSEGTDFNFTKFRDFVYSLYFNSVTNQFVLTFTKPSGLVDQGCLRVIKRGGQNDTLISETCESSSSATLYSDISAYGNGTYIATFYATGSGAWDIVSLLTKTIGGGLATGIFNELNKNDRLFYAFIFSGVIVFMFMITPVLAVVGIILAILGSAALGFQLIDYTILIGISIVGGVIIWFLKK